MRDFWQRLAGHILVISFGIVLLIHFVLFWLNDGVYIYEHNRVVRGFETALAVAVIAFGIWGIRKLWIEWWHEQRRKHQGGIDA